MPYKNNNNIIILNININALLCYIVTPCMIYLLNSPLISTFNHHLLLYSCFVDYLVFQFFDTDKKSCIHSSISINVKWENTEITSGKLSSKNFQVKSLKSMSLQLLFCYFYLFSLCNENFIKFSTRNNNLQPCT